MGEREIKYIDRKEIRIEEKSEREREREREREKD